MKIAKIFTPTADGTRGLQMPNCDENNSLCFVGGDCETKTKGSVSRNNRRKVKCCKCFKISCFDSFNKHVKTYHHTESETIHPIEIVNTTITSFFW